MLEERRNATISFKLAEAKRRYPHFWISVVLAYAVDRFSIPMGREVGFFIPEPVGGRSAPESNDVMLDKRGLIYMVDRHVGFDVLEFEGG